MPQTQSTARTYKPEDLRVAVRSVLEVVRVPRYDAALVARALVAADQRGIFSHGLIRLPLYVTALESGGMNPTPNLRWRRTEGATAVLDADHAIGHVGMQAAIDRAIHLARRYGTATVAVERSTHYGAGNYWSDQLTDVGLIGILTSSTGPVVAPHGGRETILGTNPLTISVPSSGSHSLTADMATSAGAYGKVLAAREAGQTIPEGWAVGPDGTPTTDPATAIEGALIPFGGPKGSGLSVLLEALASSLSGANFAFETVDIWVNPAHRMNTGHLVIAIDPAFFDGLAHTRDRVATLQERVRTAGPSGDVQAPGDPEIARSNCSAGRIELAEAACLAFEQVLDRLNVPRPAALPLS
ncbi:Ldh family oxidoreductase [Pseudactinotalea sp. Z1748]|uniref:Ldh family oxidoreductase n=1 Tax=Pseudactinotalea sp. Z1748 TaxID=3413027 RepID=UPI003C7A6A39